MMGEAAVDPDDYVARLSGWQRDLVILLRDAILASADFEETIKWTNLVFMGDGPCILIRAEEHRVLLGFWRGKRLVELDRRIKSSGKYELGNITFRDGASVEPGEIRSLAVAARALNRELGNPAARQ